MLTYISLVGHNHLTHSLLYTVENLMWIITVLNVENRTVIWIQNCCRCMGGRPSWFYSWWEPRLAVAAQHHENPQTLLTQGKVKVQNSKHSFYCTHIFSYHKILSRLATDRPISSPTDTMWHVGYRITGEEVWETHSQPPILPEKGDVLLLQPWR